MEVYEALGKSSGKSKRPPCEQCWPGIEDNNIDPWEVYKIVTMDPSGITATGIISTSEILGVKDPQECLMKVQRIVSEINNLEKEQPKDTGESNKWR